MEYTIRKGPIAVLAGIAVLTLTGLFFVPPVMQSQAYHLFADIRTCLGLPNFWNVVSNLPFIVIVAIGLYSFREHAASAILFLGIFLTGFGSIYYHWNPNDESLFWDRLPMTMAFMAIFANAIEERVHPGFGAQALRPLLFLGLSSLVLWRANGDLRLYIWVQFFPCVAVLLILWLFPPKYTRGSDWLLAFALYALAKVFEYFDAAIFDAGHVLSGHTLKHLTAAGACYVVLLHFQKRRLVHARR